MIASKNKSIRKLSNRLKLVILFVDYIIFAVLFLTIEDIVYSQLGIERVYPWLFRVLIYFIFYTLSEFYFNGTIGMKFFGVSIVNKKRGKLSKSFIIYSLLVFLDRFLLLLLVYFFRVFFYSKPNLLISEKYSGLRWSK